MSPTEQIADFVARFHYMPNLVGRPLWIEVLIKTQENSPGYGAWCMYDSKNDDARRAFGALCHRLYTSAEKWKIDTHN